MIQSPDRYRLNFENRMLLGERSGIISLKIESNLPVWGNNFELVRRWTMLTEILLAVAAATSVPAATCASAQQSADVRAFYKSLPSAPPLVARRHMNLPEEIVSSALDSEHATGVSGQHFNAVWKSLSEWPYGFFILDQKGWILKFQAPVPPLLGNARKDAFTDVKAPGENGLISHLRPDLVSSIHAVTLPGGLGRDGKMREGMTRAVIFYDASGESVFGIYASLAGEALPTEAIPAFEKTLSLMRALPQVCSRAAGSNAAQSIPTPEAWEYVRMTPAQRMELRARVRTLPKEKQDEHNDALMVEVRKLPTYLYEALSNEMVALEHCKTGAYHGPLPPPPKLTAWEYVKRVPHQRYHYRLRARALSPTERATHEQDLAKELATLPQWLQASLAEEAKRYDGYLGLDPCARVTANFSTAALVPEGPVEMSKSARWEMTSAKGRSYRIFISQPAEPAPPGGYPVLYVLDANSNFGTVTETLRMQGRRPERTGISSALVVGIGYPTDEPFDAARRGYDYVVHSPGATSPKHGEGGMLDPDSGGGAADFLSFITEELKPAVEKRYAIDRQKQTLLGHSFGGFFTLYTLFQRPQAFQNYLALSPSVWWNDRSLLRDQEKFIASRKPADAPINLFVAVGSREETSKIPMVTDSREIAARMQSVTDRGVTTQFFLVEGEDHGSIVPTTISRALRARQGDGFEKIAAK